jgi:hypothetical protein
MVFKTTKKLADKSENCGCHEVRDWSELECERYATAGEAQIGHEKYIEKYKELTNE